MKGVISIMLVCFWITLTSAIPSATISHWYMQVITCVGAASSCWFLCTMWDKLKKL